MMEEVRHEIERIESKCEEHEQVMRFNKFLIAAQTSDSSITTSPAKVPTRKQEIEVDNSIMDTTEKSFNIAD